MQTASVPGLVRTLLILIGIYYAFKILARFLMPILLRKMVQKAEQNFKQQAEQYAQNQSKSQTSSASNATPKPKKQVGEYIDYEEVE